jgi:hypothetical protein
MILVPVKAKITWIPVEKGGRKVPFTGITYSTVARFVEPSQRAGDGAWSVVIDFDIPVTPDSQTVGAVRFLSTEAPHEILRPGAQFDLLEGARVVAHGEVLENMSSNGTM